MQRRNKTVDRSSTAGNGRTTNLSSLPKHVLPTTIKPKPQPKKKCRTVTCLVQAIVFLMIATSVTLVYIAFHKGSGKSGIGRDILGVNNKNIEHQQVASHAPLKVDSPIHDEIENDLVEEDPDEKNEMDVTKHVVEQEPLEVLEEPPVVDIKKVDGEEEDVDHSDTNPEDTINPPRKRRTTAEANAYMEQQPSFSIDGEKALKKKLYPLYELQRKGQEKVSPIITRWLGDKDQFGKDVKYWMPKSTTSEEVLVQWQNGVERMKDEMRKKDIDLFPHLHGLDAKPVTNVVAVSDNESTTEYPMPPPKDTHVVLKPTFGKHRENVDAVFALAEGYDLKIYLLFIESLKATGFNGDLVLSVSALGSLKPGVEEYLRSNQISDNEKGVNVVAYTVTWTCYNGKGEIKEGANEGIRKCELVGMYGEDADEHVVADPREPRPVATARFELYWAWSQYYKDESWIMLIDSRDAHFQLDPFSNLPREVDGGKGWLYFFAVS